MHPSAHYAWLPHYCAWLIAWLQLGFFSKLKENATNSVKEVSRLARSAAQRLHSLTTRLVRAGQAVGGGV